MNNTINKSVLATALTFSSLIATAPIAQAEVSANVGVVSQYFFRGIAQTGTASASAGVDYENSGFYIGTWAADVSDGLEVDLYAGYGFETDAGLGLSIGATTYQYTGNFDSAYNELNLGVSFGMFSVSYNIGTHEEDSGLGIPESDYDFLALTGEYEGFYATYGTWGKDFDGDYIEIGYGAEVAGFDVGVAIIKNSEELDLETFEGDESMVFSLSKSF
ncbi:TorF family putative porin [Thalassotalea ponticola]|uniref:TorF family putative porin n=1 Tax=Thalassotalea ponticola TaxID=1523392 RepID=UPI0025B54BDF|nr:TorF family putative porin [Thalassotalea ponticola]MDN3652847.1 TorF family putative porin [Thalassotalea ponticola]